MSSHEFSLSGHAMGPAQEGEVKSAVIFLHGLGSNGDDLIALAPYFAKALPHTIFISPNAPDVCDMAPPGFADAYQWFSLQDRDPDILEREIEAAAPVLHGFIEEIAKAYNLPFDKILLIGFSQGTMMSLYTAPRFHEKLAGIIGYSGALLGGEELLKSSDKMQKPAVQLIHGDSDDVVDSDAMPAAQEILSKAGFDVDTLMCENLGHSIDQQGLEKGIEFAVKRLA